MPEKDDTEDKTKDIISPDEKILWKGRRNDNILNFYLIAGLAVTLIIAIFFFYQGTVEHHLGRNTLTSGKSIAAFTILIGFVVSFVLYNNKLASRYVITDKKIIVQFGLVSETIQYAYHENITHIHVKQGIISQFFNVGTVYVDSGKRIKKEMRFREVRGMHTEPANPKIIYYELKNVHNPDKVLNLIQRLVDKSRQPKHHESINEKIKVEEDKDE